MFTGCRAADDCAECSNVLAWVESQGIQPGSGRADLKLPEKFSRLAVNDTAQVLRTKDGRYFVLLKSSIGYKDNFKGTLCCSDAPRADEFINDGKGISIAGALPFEELYISKRSGETCFQVYFDLN